MNSNQEYILEFYQDLKKDHDEHVEEMRGFLEKLLKKYESENDVEKALKLIEQRYDAIFSDEDIREDMCALIANERNEVWVVTRCQKLESDARTFRDAVSDMLEPRFDTMLVQAIINRQQGWDTCVKANEKEMSEVLGMSLTECITLIHNVLDEDTLDLLRLYLHTLRKRQGML